MCDIECDGSDVMNEGIVHVTTGVHHIPTV